MLLSHALSYTQAAGTHANTLAYIATTQLTHGLHPQSTHTSGAHPSYSYYIYAHTHTGRDTLSPVGWWYAYTHHTRAHTRTHRQGYAITCGVRGDTLTLTRKRTQRVVYIRIFWPDTPQHTNTSSCIHTRTHVLATSTLVHIK